MNKRKLNKRRQFSEQIRKKVVSEFRDGKYTVLELADLYHVSATSIYRWIHKYSPAESPGINVVEMAESTDQQLKDLQQKIADLERALGQKQIKVDLLEKMIELAKDEYDLDLKKIFLGSHRVVSDPPRSHELFPERSIQGERDQQAGRLAVF